MSDRTREPSASLLAAAITGLLAMPAGGCESSDAGPATDAGPRRVLSVRIDPDMTLERFTGLCDERGGMVELHAVCGGVNSCQGFSFDDTNNQFSEHTCAGLNTCSGYSCVLPG